MKRHFDQDLEHLKELILRMGAMAEDAIAQSIRALVERDSEIATRVIALDSEIDQLETESDRLTLALIAKMQPAAVDLRFVATAMKVTPELERIADLAQDVCERAIELNREPPLTAHSFRGLLTYMLEDSTNISRAIRLTFCGKYFERMADSATNIAEMVVYLAEGRVVKHQQE